MYYVIRRNIGTHDYFVTKFETLLQAVMESSNYTNPSIITRDIELGELVKLIIETREEKSGDGE